MNLRKGLLFFVVIVCVYILFWRNAQLKDKVTQASALEFRKQELMGLSVKKPSSIFTNKLVKAAQNKQIGRHDATEKSAVNIDDQLVYGMPFFLIGPEQVQRLTDEEFQELHGDWQLSSPNDSLEISFGKDDARSISYSLRKKDESGVSGGFGGKIGKSDKGLVLMVDGRTYYVISSRSQTQMEFEMYKKTSSGEHFEYIRNFTVTKK